MHIRRLQAVGGQVAGTSGRVRLDGGDDEEGPSTEEHSAAILQALGLERRNQVPPPLT